MKIIQLAERIAALSPERLAMIGPNLLGKVKPPETRPIESEGADLGAAKVEEEKTEETALDVNLGKFDAPSNINIVEEVHLDKIIQLAERVAALSPEELALIGPFLRDKLYPPQPPTVEEKKAEKTTYDVKLEKFDAASKIKVIKEVRAFTSLGLKEAKELVEKAPVITKQGVTKEEAVGIIQKLRAVGGVALME